MDAVARMPDLVRIAGSLDLAPVLAWLDSVWLRGR
jgi:hypothetical protein